MEDRRSRRLYRISGILALVGSAHFFLRWQPLLGLLGLGAASLLFYFAWVPEATSHSDDGWEQGWDDGSDEEDLSNILFEMEWHAPPHSRPTRESADARPSPPASPPEKGRSVDLH